MRVGRATEEENLSRDRGNQGYSQEGASSRKNEFSLSYGEDLTGTVLRKISFDSNIAEFIGFSEGKKRLLRGAKRGVQIAATKLRSGGV